MAQLRSVTCHMGSHSVTCYPTQMNTPRLRMELKRGIVIEVLWCRKRC